VGVATYPDDGATIEDLVDAADRGIDAALSEGGDRAVQAEDSSRYEAEEVEPAPAPEPADEGDEWDIGV
jgi:hypothetical protein